MHNANMRRFSKKKKYAILLVLLIAVTVCIVYIKCTRVVYFKDFNSNVPSTTDAEYLGVSDLRILQIFGDGDSENQLKSLAKEMIEKSYSNSDSSNPFHDSISDALYTRLNPNYNVDAVVQLADVEVECLAHKNKAIVYWSRDCSYHAKENVVICKLNTNNKPYDRLYFEKIDGEWRVVEFMQPA